MAPPPAALPPDAATIGNPIREELEDRSFYKHLYSWAAGVIAILAAIAALVSYNSIGQMRAERELEWAHLEGPSAGREAAAAPDSYAGAAE